MGKVIRMVGNFFTHGVDPYFISRVYHAFGSHHTYCSICLRFHPGGCAPWRAKRI